MDCKIKTRKVSSRPVFGLPKELSANELPTYGDVLKFYFWVQNDAKNKSITKRKDTVAELSQVVATRVEEIWIKASIPIVSHDRVLHLFRSYYNKYLKLLKPFKQRQNQDKYKLMLNSFRDEGHSRLFDIAACKCDFDKCHCDKERKVPIHEQSFLSDQRSTRLMFMSNIDRTLSRKLKCKYKRKLANASRVQKYRQCTVGESRSSEVAQNESSDESDEDIPLAEIQTNMRMKRKRQTGQNDDESDELLSPEMQATSSGRIPAESSTPKTALRKSTRLNRDLPTLARACDRHGVSDRAAAALASAVLQDFGLISPEDSKNVVDKNKIRRARQRKRKILQDTETYNAEALHSLYFDGRKDHTTTNVMKGSKWYKQRVVEEHLSLIEEPGSRYIGHITPLSGTAEDIKSSLLRFLKDRLVENKTQRN
jgi:hypothetical protein